MAPLGERGKTENKRQSDGHGVDVCNRCAVVDCGSVGPVERSGSYWVHELEHSTSLRNGI